MNQTTDFLDFVAASPSSYHAAAEVAERLAADGFARQDETAAWDARPGGHVLVRGGAVLAWWVPEDASPRSDSGSSVPTPIPPVSPSSRIRRPPPLGWQQAAVEVYGGPILHSWFDRELTFAGRVVLADGSQRLVSTGPVARIPNLAIHLDRSTELEVDRQQHPADRGHHRHDGPGCCRGGRGG
ncbi:hypothetical protein QP028_15795 [Corynebacterium suedekumii]|nr:hypothetical protein QP028_15795 [Corynebacterium suedekumii]